MQLEEFFDYKNKLVEDLLTNPSIVRLLIDDETETQTESVMGLMKEQYMQS